MNLPKPRRVEIVTFTSEEVRAMLAKAAKTQNPLRNQALIITLLDTGIRAGESMALTLRDIHWSEGWLLVNGKTGERAVPFGRKAKLALRKYIDRERTAQHHHVEEVFLGVHGNELKRSAITHRLIDIAKDANVQASKLGPHTFRHTFAVEFIRAGGDAFTLQRIFGHTTLGMTRRYVHLAKSDLRATHKRYGPGDRLL